MGNFDKYIGGKYFKDIGVMYVLDDDELRVREDRK